MSQQNLSKSELAALDLLITYLQENKIPGVVNFCVGLGAAAAVVGAAAAVVGAAASVVSAVTAVTSSAALDESQAAALSQLAEANNVNANLSLDQLIALRNQLA